MLARPNKYKILNTMKGIPTFLLPLNLLSTMAPYDRDQHTYYSRSPSPVLPEMPTAQPAGIPTTSYPAQVPYYAPPVMMHAITEPLPRFQYGQQGSPMLDHSPSEHALFPHNEPPFSAPAGHLNAVPGTYGEVSQAWYS